MKRYRILVTMLALVGTTFACTQTQPATPSPDARSATFVMVENQVEARERERDDYLPAEVGQILPVAGQARTGEESRAQLNLMPDETVVRMGPDTEFALTELTDQTDDLFARLELAVGQLWIILTGGEMQVETDLGTASVRGSQMGVRYVPGTSLTATCLEGNCRVSNDYGTTDFTAGQAVDVPGPGQPPSAPRHIDSHEYDGWIEVLRATRIGPGLGDRVWLDMDMDGIQDPDEQGLAGVTVYLADEHGNPVDTTVTDSEGYYRFPHIAPGTYFLIFEPPGDYLFSPQDVGGDDTLDSDPYPDIGKTPLFHVASEGLTLLDWDAGVYPRSLAPDSSPTPTATASQTPEPPPPCGCNTPGVQFEVVEYDGSPGWSDCGQATACHSIIGDQQVDSGTVIGTSVCSMRVICPTP